MPPNDEQGRADRLLAKMHRVLSHDLPNQIVAMQSLLQVLELEEAKRLGDEGRECMRRLHRVARKAAGQVRFLREMARLRTPMTRVEHLTLATLMREIEIELGQQMPAAPVQCRLVHDSDRFAADPRRLVLAVVEIVRPFVDRAPGRPCVLAIGGRTVGDGVELYGELSWAAPGTTEPAAPAPKPQESLDIVLAEEMLSGFGARLSEIREERDCNRFTLLVSASTDHG